MAMRALPIEDMDLSNSAVAMLPESLLALSESLSLSDVDWSEIRSGLPGSSELILETLGSKG